MIAQFSLQERGDDPRSCYPSPCLHVTRRSSPNHGASDIMTISM